MIDDETSYCFSLAFFLRFMISRKSYSIADNRCVRLPCEDTEMHCSTFCLCLVLGLSPWTRQ
jgi:hypothetical protein